MVGRKGRRHVQQDEENARAGFGVRVVVGGLTSTGSTTKMLPVGIGTCMSLGRMGICPSNGWERTTFVGGAWLRTLLGGVRPAPRFPSRRCQAGGRALKVTPGWMSPSILSGIGVRAQPGTCCCTAVQPTI